MSQLPVLPEQHFSPEQRSRLADDLLARLPEVDNQRHRMHRTYWVVAGACLVVAAATLGTTLGLRGNSGGEPDRPAHMAPSCPPPVHVVLLDSANQAGSVPQSSGIVHASIGQPTSVVASVTLTRPVSALDAQLIVGKPGSVAGVGATSGLPPNAAARPGNQIATSPTFNSTVVGSGQVQVQAVVSAPGDYPIFVYVKYQDTSAYAQSVACDTGLPTDGMSQIGTLLVS